MFQRSGEPWLYDDVTGRIVGVKSPDGTERTFDGVTGCYLDAQNRIASTAIPTTPTPFVWETAAADTNGMLNTSTGVITLPFTGNYDFVFMFNGDAASGTQLLYSAAQIWNGVSWVNSTYSGRRDAIRTGESKQQIFASTNKFNAGTQLRFPTWASSNNITINTVTNAGGSAFTIPAARLLITGEKVS